MVDPSIGLSERPTIVVVGAATRDVSATDRRGWKLGGGVTYSALAAANLGVQVAALIGVDGEAATARELDSLRRAGVDVLLVPLEHGPIFDNQKTPTGRVQYALGASDQIPVSALPDVVARAQGGAARSRRRRAGRQLVIGIRAAIHS